MLVFHIYCAVRAVVLAVLAGDAGRIAYLGLVLIISRRAARHLFLALVRHDGDQMLRTGVRAVLAAYALFRVYDRGAVDYVDSVIAAYLGAAAQTAAAGSAELVGQRVDLFDRLFAGLNAQLLIQLGSLEATAAFNEGHLLLDLGDVVEGVDDDFLSAFYGAGHAAHALVIVDDGVIIDDRNGSLRACSLAFAAGNTAEAAGRPDDLVVFLRRGARNEVAGLSRHHPDQVLRAALFVGAGAAAVALFAVDDHMPVLKLHGVEFAELYA